MTFPTLTTLISSNHSKLTKTKLIAVDLCNTIAKVNEAIEDIFGPVPNPSILYHPATPPLLLGQSEKPDRPGDISFCGALPGLRKSIKPSCKPGVGNSLPHLPPRMDKRYFNKVVKPK